MNQQSKDQIFQLLSNIEENKKVANMKTTEEKVKFLQSFSDLLDSPRFRKHENARLFAGLRDYSLNMLRVFEYELKEEQAKNNSNKNQTKSNKSTSTTTQKISKSDLPHLYDNFSNIDEEEVRDAILSRHNDERDSLGRSPYKYNLDLE